MRAKKKQKEVVTPETEKKEKHIPDYVNREKLKTAMIKTNMNIELCAIEAGVPIEDLTKWIAEDYEEIKQWKEIVYVKTATDAFNILIDLAQNEEITITEEMRNKRQKYSSEAQIKAITTILDRVGYKIGLATKQQKKEPNKQPIVTLIPADKYLQKQQEETNEEPETDADTNTEPESKIDNPHSEIQNPHSEIQNPHSEIQNPHSEIHSPQSEEEEREEGEKEGRKGKRGKNCNKFRFAVNPQRSPQS
jgi:hypothetical protein